MRKRQQVYVPTKAIATVLAMRDRLFSLTKLPRTLRETGKITEAQLDEVAEKAFK